MTKKEIIIWIAGFIDGEGCFNITRTRTTIHPRVLIVNTNLDSLKLIQGLYGGDITSRKVREKWKNFNSLRLQWRNAKKLISDIFPYLILKKKQAKLCLDCWKTKDINERLIIKEQMHVLNKRGS